MIGKYFDIKDACRKGLLKYLEQAVSTIPKLENPSILDLGCGSGVPTLWLAERYHGQLMAVDSDRKSIARLKEQVVKLHLSDRFALHSCSIFDPPFERNQFDLILAEGILHIVGFEKGFLFAINLLKNHKYFIIHDEAQHHPDKVKFIESNPCKLLDSFVLDHTVWWKDYFACLESKISKIDNSELRELFKQDMTEIELIKRDPSQFNSRYYVIQKEE